MRVAVEREGRRRFSVCFCRRQPATDGIPRAHDHGAEEGLKAEAGCLDSARRLSSKRSSISSDGSGEGCGIKSVKYLYLRLVSSPLPPRGVEETMWQPVEGKRSVIFVCKIKEED